MPDTYCIATDETGAVIIPPTGDFCIQRYSIRKRKSMQPIVPRPEKPPLFNPLRGVTVDNGFDPFLGPPYPPYVGFMAQGGKVALPDGFVYATLRWTLPQVIITTDTISAGHNRVDVFVQNYRWPTWNNVNDYETNTRVTWNGVRYYALMGNGDTVHNIANQPDTSPTFWAVDDTLLSLYLDYHQPFGSDPLFGYFGKDTGANGFFLGDAVTPVTGAHHDLTYADDGSPTFSNAVFHLHFKSIHPTITTTVNLHVAAISSAGTALSAVFGVAMTLDNSPF